MNRRFTLGAAAAVLVAGLALPAMGAASATTTANITGTISDSSGAPLGGETVQLWAEPPDAVIAAENVGDTTPWHLVTTATTDATGQFSASVSSSDVSAYANPDGTVNMDAMTAGGSSFYAFTVDASAPSSTGMAITQRAGAVYDPSIFCHAPVLIHVYDPHWTAIGETSIRISGDEYQRFTYSAGQSSSLGVAVANQSGGWTEQGTHSKSSTTQIAFARFGSGQSHRYLTQFQYGEWTTGCNTFAQAYKYIGGGENPTQQAPPASLCKSYPAGSVPSFYRSKAVTFSAAISIPDIGIGLSGQTGWDSSGMITYTLGSHSHFICGQNDYPGGDPKVLDMGQ